MRSRQQPSPDQLALFVLDEQAAEPTSTEPAQQEQARPSSLREALQRRREEWERRRQDDPEGVAREEEEARAHAAEALRLFTRSSGFQRWAENQERTQRLISGVSLLRAQTAAQRSSLAQLQGISAGFRTPDLSVALRTQMNGIIKGALANYPLQSLASVMAQSVGITDVVGKQAELLTRGVLAQFPTGSIAQSLRTVVNTNFTPSAAASLSLIGSQASLRIGMQAASIATPAMDGIVSSLGALGAAHHTGIRSIISQVGIGVTFPRASVIDTLRLGGQPTNFAPYTAQLFGGALPLVQEQERLVGLVRQTLRRLPQSLIDELATLTDEDEPQAAAQPQTLGTTSLLAPTSSDLPLLQEEARRLDFSARSQQVFLHIADSIAALPSGMQEAYANKSNQSLIAMLVFLAALSTGNAVGFLALSGGYYGTVKPILDHFFKGE